MGTELETENKKLFLAFANESSVTLDSQFYDWVVNQNLKFIDYSNFVSTGETFYLISDMGYVNKLDQDNLSNNKIYSGIGKRLNLGDNFKVTPTIKLSNDSRIVHLVDRSLNNNNISRGLKAAKTSGTNFLFVSVDGFLLSNFRNVVAEKSIDSVVVVGTSSEFNAMSPGNRS